MKTFNISFEFFPPKTTDGVNNLRHAIHDLAKCNPEFMSVTFGAGGSTREGTLEAISLLRQNAKCDVAPHISCIGSSRDDLIQIINEYQSNSVKRVVALRGDLPSGMGQAGELRYASELVHLIRQTIGNDWHIDVAAYPEIHPQALSPMNDVLNLKRKVDAGANGAITQYFYNPDAYFYYLDECQLHGVQVPIVPGVMPITHFAKLARFSDQCGAEIPRWIRKRLESYGDDIASIQQFGLEVVVALCDKLRSGGAPGFHFYTLNRADAILNILDALGLQHEIQQSNSVGALTI